MGDGKRLCRGHTAMGWFDNQVGREVGLGWHTTRQGRGLVARFFQLGQRPLGCMKV